jgi:hypothetical protein
MTDSSIICVDCAQKRHPEIDGHQLMADAVEAAEEKKGNCLNWGENDDIRTEITEDVRAAEEAADLHPLTEYDLSSDEVFAESGCWCDDCGKELVEPSPDEDEEEIDMDEETQALDDYLAEDEVK